MPPLPRTPKDRVYSLTLLALITMLGAALRWPDAGHSLWVDELHTSWVVDGSFGEVLERAEEGNYPPLFFWLVWPLVQAFGQSEWVVRGVSLVAGTALIPVAWWAARRLTGSQAAAILAALLVAGDRLYGIRFSQEARPYAVIQLLAVVQIVWFYDVATHGDRWQRVGWIAASAAMFYLHYTSVLLIGGQIAWFFLRWLAPNPSAENSASDSPYSLTNFALDLLILALLCLPAAPHVLDIAARREQWAQFIEQRPFQEVFTIFPLSVYLAAPTLAAVLAYRFIWQRDAEASQAPSGDARQQGDLATGSLLLCCFFVPLLFAWLTTWYDFARLFFARYLLTGFVCLPLLAGWLLASFRNQRVRWVFGATALACLQFSGGPLQYYLENADFSGHFTEDWRGAVDYVNRVRRVEEPVFVDAGLIEGQSLREYAPDELLRSYLLCPVSGIYALDGGENLHPLPPWQPGAGDPFGLGPHIELVRGRRFAWLILRGPEPADYIAERVVDWLARQRIDARIETAEDDFNGVKVVGISIQ